MKIARACQAAGLGFCALLAQSRAGAQLSMYTVVDLALRNSPQVRIGVADVQRAQAGVMETRDTYKPSFQLGSSLGYSYGFPIGQPEVFSLSAQSLAFSFSQKDYVRSARESLQSAQLKLKDTREQVILDTALDYIQLATVSQQIAALDQENGYVGTLIGIEDARVSAGRDNKIELTRARLTAAEVGLRRIHLLNQSDLLRAELAHLTGLAATNMVAEPQTIPAVPAPTPLSPASLQLSNIDAEIMNSNGGVQAAYATAKSKLYTAFGDSRQNNRPTVTFVGAYGLFSNSFNNYSQYYLHFQQSNFGAGIQINIPLFDASRRARAEDSSANATYAAAQADQLRDQTSEQVLQLEKSLAELAAQEQVAELQSELAQDQLATVTTEMQSGGDSPTLAPVTPREAQQAHIQERSRYIDMLDAQFQLSKAQLNLMRSLGTIEDWAMSIPPAKP